MSDYPLDPWGEMATLPGEKHAIEVALNVARQYGYGNLISRLQDEWSKRLQENSGLDKNTADAGAWKASWFWSRIDELNARVALLEAVAVAARNCPRDSFLNPELDAALKALDGEEGSN